MTSESKSLGETLIEMKAKRIKFGEEMRAGTKTWGSGDCVWKYIPESNQLCFVANDYGVDLAICNSIEGFYDWMSHINENKWATPEVIGTLFVAVDDIFDGTTRNWKGAQDVVDILAQIKANNDPYLKKYVGI